VGHGDGPQKTGLSIFCRSPWRAHGRRRPEPEIFSPQRDPLRAPAWRSFYRDGFRAVGIDRILAGAGFAKKTLDHHFAAKEELIVALREKRDRELCASIVATVEAAGKSPAKRLLAVFDWLEAWFGSADFNGWVFIRALSEYPEASLAIPRAAWNHKVAVKEILAQRCEAAGAKDPGALAETLSLLIDGSIVVARGTRETGLARSARAKAAVLLKWAAV
jgi:AcrR family transcriptional regulator